MELLNNINKFFSTKWYFLITKVYFSFSST